MTICKKCGTVFDEYYNVCPRCGTLYEPEDKPAGITGSINDVIKTESDENLPLKDIYGPDPGAALSGSGGTLPSLDPDYVGSRANLPTTGSADVSEATVTMADPAAPDPDGTLPMNSPYAPESDATIPMRSPASPDPDGTLPMNSPYAPESDATMPMRKPASGVQPPVSDNAATQEVILPGGAQTAYGDQYNAPVQNVRVAKEKKPGKKGSKGKIIAIIVAVCIVLAGLGVGAFFLFANNNNSSQTQLEEQISLGDKYLAEEKYPEAIEAFKKAIEIDPDNPDLYLKLAKAYTGNKQPDKALETLQQGYERTKSDAIKAELDAMDGDTSDTGDPETLRSNAQSLNMGVLNLYVGVTNGMINSSLSSDELNGLDPAKLPAPDADAASKEAAANALTVRDTVTYAGTGDKFNETTVTNYVYKGAQIYYREDSDGTPLTLDTTIGQIRSADTETSQISEPSQVSEPSEPSEESSTPVPTTEANLRQFASELTTDYKTLYAAVASGVLTSSSSAAELGGLDPSKLPGPAATVSERRKAADSLTVSDAIAYAGRESVINESNIDQFVFSGTTIYYKEDQSGSPLAMDTSLSELYNDTETSKPESSTESSDESKPESSTESSSVNAELAGIWKMTFNQKKYTTSELQSARDNLDFDEFTVILNNDGTASSYKIMTDGKTDIIGEGTWSITGSDVTITINGDAAKFTYKDGVLWSETFGDKAYFEKNGGLFPRSTESSVTESSAPESSAPESSVTDTSESVVGTWKAKYDINKVPDDEKTMVETIMNSVDVTMTFTSDGKVKVDTYMSLMGETSSNTQESRWKQEGSKIYVSDSDVEPDSSSGSAFIIQNGKLYNDNSTGGEDTSYIYYEKQ